MKGQDSTEEYLPKKGWLGDYLNFTSGLEACPRFRFFSAACALGAALNNKVWIQRGDVGLLPKLFPNPWIMLLAPPGRGHKTTTINMACNCLQSACPEVRLLADKLTPESLVSSLSQPRMEKEMIRIGPKDATGLIKAPELSVFFGKQQYNIGLVSLVTDLYDYREKWKSETIGRGKDVLKNNCISIMGGSTPDWLQHMLPEDAFTGGFMSRFIIVEMPPGYVKRKAFPKRHTGKGWEALIKNLRNLTNLKGEVKWSDEAIELYTEYYESFTPTGDPQKDAYREREDEQILKLGMLLDISLHNELVLTAEGIKAAKALLTSLQVESFPRIERLATHPRMMLVQEIVDFLRLHGSLDEGDLLKMCYKNLSQGERQFYEALSILKRTGTIEVSGRPGEYVYSIAEEE